jgi:hypothetical protein
MRHFFLLGILGACGGADPLEASEVRFSLYEVDRLTTRFRQEDVEAQLEVELAFLMRRTCPKIERARYVPDGKSRLGVLQVWGQHMDGVWGLVGRSADNQFGEAVAKTESDASLRFALGCRDCEIVLGRHADKQKIGCVGPGHSLRLRGGRLVY